MESQSGGGCCGAKKRDPTAAPKSGESFRVGGPKPTRLKTGGAQGGHTYSKEDTIDVQPIIDAKIVLLGDSGVGKSSIA